MTGPDDDGYALALASFDVLRVAVLPGSGFVARYPGVLCFGAPPAHDGDIGELADLLAICRDASAEPDTPGQLVHRLARRLAASRSNRTSALSFGTVAALPTGLAVLLAGRVRLEGDAADAVRLSGEHSLAWLDRVIDTPTEPISLLGAELGEPADLQLLDLQRGVVLGGGAMLMPAGAASPSRADGSRPARENPLGAGRVRPQWRSLRRWFVRPEQEPEQQHNSTTVRLTRQAGRVSEMPPDPADIRTREHPVVGTLRFDDGTTLVLGRGHVVGSAPDSDDRVRNGEVDSAMLNDPVGGVAPVHFELSTVGGCQVEVRDLEAPGGTFIAQPGAAGWKRLEAGAGVTLADGARVGFGRRTAVFRAAVRADGPEVSD